MLKVRQNFEEVVPEKLRFKLDPDSLGFQDTTECEYLEGIIGQERAVKAVRIGLEIESPGYNIYAAGLTGTGKTSTIKSLLNQLDLGKKMPDDICYVNNFRNPDMPLVIMIPAGEGIKFQKDMEEMILHLRKQIPHIFESEDFKKASEQIVSTHMAKQKEMVKDFNEKIQKENFQLVQYQIGPYTKQDVAPLYEGKPVPIEQLEALAEQDKYRKETLEKTRVKLSELRSELDTLMRETRQIEKEIRKEMNSLEHKTGLPVVSGMVSDIRLKYGKYSDKVKSYLDEVLENILSNLKMFKDGDEDQKQQSEQIPPPYYPSVPERRFIEYKVNVVVDNSQTKKVPVIIETAPTYKNLFGTIEREIDRSGFWKTDFTRIKAGSLLRANGGYIVFNALEALIEPGVWSFLKRTLKNRQLNMQPYDPFSLASTAMKPDPIPIDIKVIMIGDNYLYHLLYNLEEDFKKIFKTKAQFDTEMPNRQEHVNDYISFIKRIIEDEKLLQFHKSAVTAIIEFGIRLSGKQKKLSTRFSDIADLIREANYWAGKDKSTLVEGKHVDKAYKEKIERLNLAEDKIQEMIEDGNIMIDTEGHVIGQVNGLSVYDMGDYSFGKPSRITAQTSMGRAGIINIEREAKLSGKTHDKGVLILEGYFRGKYAQDKPLTMSASICFEQSYGGVDGDSASSTEIYAILSSLSELPLRQDIAVTGSVNQRGEIQPIGGVNQKIEGFYDVCKVKGLTGNHGVIIPSQNISELMLRKDVVEAVSKGTFHIYPVSTIDDGITILTGIEPGEKDKDGDYSPGTVNFLVNEKLRTIVQGLKDFGEEEKKETKAEE
ncbi:MAG: AAA family ATPase [Deltaproteobacteria bacterium]|nr:AAA family ATPase [Deltaproteobacteria bacterium]